tara:strand:- start:173 stop:427 length:255 start_codon:yes stop_codon:yes gene_type:complete
MKAKTTKRKKETMTKKKKQITTCDYHDVDRENKPLVYMFHNVRHNLHLFINAENAEEAYEQFDKCGFLNRDEWKIFLEAGSQPA